MKYFYYTTFFVSLFFGCNLKKEQAPATLEVTWYIPIRYNYVTKEFPEEYHLTSMDKLPWRLLDAIDAGRIKTYDSTLKEISRAEVEASITPNMRSVISLTKEECDIMLANGDSSFLDSLVPKQSPQQLKAIYASRRGIDSLIITKYAIPFETKVCEIELVEKVTLDTTLRSQKGNVEYIRLIVPKEFTKSGRNEILCQVKYEDFKTLGIPEQKIIDQHAFMIYADDAELTIDDGKSIQRLSSLKKTKTEEGIQHDQIKKTVFKYFAKNLIVLKYDENSKDAPIMEVDY